MNEDTARRRLVEELARIRRRLDAAEVAGMSLLMDACRAGGPPPLDSLESQRMLAGLRDRDAERVRDVVAALRRLEAGDYGTCVACGRAIEPDRLEVLPESERCAACAV